MVLWQSIKIHIKLINIKKHNTMLLARMDGYTSYYVSAWFYIYVFFQLYVVCRVNVDLH